MSEVATETICFGETSISCDLGRRRPSEISVVAREVDVALELRRRSAREAACGERRTRTRSSRKLPFASMRRVRLRDDVLLLLVRGEVDDLVGDLALDDLAVGRSR